MRERIVERRLVDGVKKMGGLCFKVEAVSVEGFPDRMVIYDGKIRLVELKAPGKHPRPSQVYLFDKICAQGIVVTVLSTVEQVDEFLRTLYEH